MGILKEGIVWLDIWGYEIVRYIVEFYMRGVRGEEDVGNSLGIKVGRIWELILGC